MTISPADLQKGSSVNRQRNAFRAAAIILVAIGANIILSLSLGFQSGDWQHFVGAGVAAIFGFITVYGIWLIRQNRAAAGMWTIIGSFLTMQLITTILIADMGIVLGLSEILLVSIIAFYALPVKQIGRAIAISVVAAVVTVGVDTLDLAVSLPASDAFRQSLLALTGAFVFLNLILILRQFMSFPLRGKLITLLVGITAVAITVVGGFFIYNININLRQQISIDQIHDAEVKEAAIQAFIANARSDVSLLTQSPTIEEYLQAANDGDSGNKAEAIATLEAEFSAFSRNRLFYDQIRFLDVTGHEIVRVNQTLGDFAAVSPENLQNKADRYYFQNSIALAPGEMYISPLDLNVEHGQIETPHKPILRFGMPVYEGDQIAGVIVTNVLAEKFLNPLGGGGAPAFLVDIDGYYLYHPNSRKRWGRDLGTGYTVSQDYPELASELFSGAVGTHETEEQFFAYTPITLPDESAPRWRLVNFRSVEALFAPITEARNSALLLVGGTVLAAAVMGAVISQALAKPLMLLTRAAEKATEGDWSTRVTVGRQDEIGMLAQAFNIMSEHMQRAFDLLETRVADRTRDLALATEVGQNISQVREIATLLVEAVELVRSRFDLYYAQIYLADDAGRNLVLQAGSGEIGRELVARGHRLPLTLESIKGSAAALKQAVIVPDTAASATFLANPLLPDTRSEIVVPLLLGDHALGVLDLQSNQPNSLTEEILPAFEALAGQLAVAIENATIFTQANEARAEVEVQARRLARGRWEDSLDAIERREYIGFSYEDGRIEPLPEPVVGAGQDVSMLDLPITVSGEPVGTIQVEAAAEEMWTLDDANMVASVAQQAAQRLENLRLLSEAERYRNEAEAAMRRLAREGWEGYLKTSDLAHVGYFYDQNQVGPLAAGQESPVSISQDLTVRGETIGHLAIADVDESDDVAVEMVTAVARQLSDHIESMRLAIQTEQALAGTEALYRGSDRIVRADTIEEVLKALVDSTYLKRFDRHVIMLLDQSGDDQQPQSVFVAALQQNDDQPPQFPVDARFELEQFPIIKWFSRDEPTLFEDVSSAERVDEDFKSAMAALKTRGLATFPLVAGGHWIGVMMAQSEKPVSWDDEQARQTDSLVDQAATVIQAIQLLQETQRRAERETLVNRITQKIQRTVTMENALETAVSELGKALQARYAQVEIMPAAHPTREETAVLPGNDSNGGKQT